MHVLLRQKARALYANMKLFVIDSDELFVVCLRGCGRSILMLHYFPMVFLNKLDDSCLALAFSLSLCQVGEDRVLSCFWDEKKVQQSFRGR